jgi:HSP20 family protein
MPLTFAAYDEGHRAHAHQTQQTHRRIFNMSILIRRNPIREMAAMQRAVDRLFEDTWREFGMEQGGDNVLALDVHESDQAFLITANIPGVNMESVEVTLHDGVLSISAELPQPEVKEGVRVRLQERPFGTYSRTVRLPKAVDGEKVEAAYENGVLALTLPKTPDAQPRQIPIRNSGNLASQN